MRSSFRFAALWLLLATLAPAPGADAAGGLSFLQTLRNGDGSVEQLKGTSALAISPDGKNVYAAGTDDDALVVFARDDGGLLQFVEAQIDNVGAVTGLDQVRAVRVSPDGRHVYAAGTRGDAVVVFARDLTEGRLAFVERKLDGVDGVDGLNGADALAFSPDGTHLYVGGAEDSAIAVFSRDAETGALAFVEQQRNGAFGVSGLDQVRALAVSSGGADVYASADKSVLVFRRNLVDGTLTILERHTNGDNGVDGIDGGVGIVVSPDGGQVYAAGVRSQSVAAFTRDPSTGGLTFLERERDTVNGVEGLQGVRGLTISPDGAHIYAVANEDDAVTLFDRDAGTGEIAFVAAYFDDVGDVTDLSGARGVAISDDGANLYVAAASDRAITVFATTCGDGTRDPDEQCDDANEARGDGCSPGCRIECSSATDCDDADTCTEQRCNSGECSNPRCGFDGSLCELADSVPSLEDEPTCAPVPPKLRRAIVRRINRASRLIQKASRREDPDLSTLVDRVTAELAAIEKRAERLEKNHRIPLDCRDAIERRIAALSGALQDMLLHENACAP